MPARICSASGPSPGSRAARAAAELSSTASRTGPFSPFSRRRATSALYEASAPRRASTGTRSMPTSRGSKVSSRTCPSRTTHTREVDVVVSSSRPSSPRKTSEEWPRSAKTPATMGAMRGSATPTACAFTRAGLVSGPRKLKTVRMPSWPRATPTWRRAGWNFTAKQKVIPASSATSATRFGVSSRLTPSFSRTSEAPEAEEAARLPCLTTFAPVPATTIADMVEMLTVLAPSPPVPTMSTVRPGTSITLACSYIARTRPVISSTVSPLARSATANPAICTSVASPRMMRSIAQAVSAALWSRPSSSPFSTRGQERPAVVSPPAGVTALIGRSWGPSRSRDIQRVLRGACGAPAGRLHPIGPRNGEEPRPCTGRGPRRGDRR